MTKEEKRKEVNKLTIEILDLCVKAAKVATKPRSKYKKTNDRRMGKIILITVQIAMLRDQLLVVRAQPRFAVGGIIPKGKEMIMCKDGKIIELNEEKES